MPIQQIEILYLIEYQNIMSPCLTVPSHKQLFDFLSGQLVIDRRFFSGRVDRKQNACVAKCRTARRRVRVPYKSHLISILSKSKSGSELKLDREGIFEILTVALQINTFLPKFQKLRASPDKQILKILDHTRPKKITISNQFLNPIQNELFPVNFRFEITESKLFRNLIAPRILILSSQLNSNF